MIQARTYSCGPYGQVRKLTDLSGLWVDVSLPSNGISSASNSELFDVETDPNNGDKVFVVGEAHTDCQFNWFGIAYSNNGGATWQMPGGNYNAVIDASTCYYKWNEVCVVDSNVIYACGIINTNNNKGVVVKSTDGGLTFNQCSALPIVVNGQDVYSIHFVTPLIGVIGMNNYIVKTIDGGITWNVMNGGQALSTSNPSPGTLLPTGPITGINIKPDQSHVIAICQDFIVETVSVAYGAYGGMTVDSWKNNFFTSNGVGLGPPVYSGFVPNQAIGYHLNGFPTPDENTIYISGDSTLGISSSTRGIAWNNSPPPGYTSPGTGLNRRASHFYLPSGAGFFNQGSTVRYATGGFFNFGGTLSDGPPALTYTPNALWTWYVDIPDSPTCYSLTECTTGNVINTSVDLSALIGSVVNISGYAGCYTVGLASSCTGAIFVTIVGTYQNCSTCGVSPDCYTLTDCAGLLPNIITSSNMTNYMGQVIKLSDYPGVCWTVSISVTCNGSIPLAGTILSAYVDCISCSTVCYQLVDCSSSFPPILTNTDIHLYVGRTVTLSTYPGYCWLVQVAPDCTGSVPLAATITSDFDDCVSCLEKCYTLTDCAGTNPIIITSTDLSSYLGKVIKIAGAPTICYIVNSSDSCLGSIVVTVDNSYDTCELCAPIIPPPPRPPVVLKTRFVQPGYGNDVCSVDFVEKINCAFAAQVYNKMIEAKYGIKTCIEDEYSKYLIKKALLDLNLIYDATLCVVPATPETCEVVVITPPTPLVCTAPSNIVVTISDPPVTTCIAPENINVEIVYQVP